MVGVIVVDVRTMVAALELKSAACAAELGQRLFGRLRRNIESPRDRARSQSVHRIVPPKHAEFQMAVVLPTANDVEAPVVAAEMLAVHVVLGVNAKAGIGNALERVAGIFVVAVGNNQTVFRYEADKFPERLLDIRKVLEEVQMVRIDVQNDRRCREEVQKRVAVFAALQNDRVPLPHAVPRAKKRQRASDHDRRVAAGFHEDMREHGGRCGLAVRAGDADGVPVGPHDIAPSLRALENRNARRARRRNFGVVVVGRRRADDAVRARDILRPMADGNVDALAD